MKNNLNKIFPFPTVQYIPLAINTISSGAVPKAHQKNTLRKIIVGEDLLSYRATLQNEYGISLPHSFPADTCPILVLNLKVNTVKYRSFYLTMLGTPIPNSYQLFTIPKSRIYKDKLYFEVYQAETGEKLASYSRFLATANLAMAKN